jgi:hypothetical protein
VADLFNSDSQLDSGLAARDSKRAC